MLRSRLAFRLNSRVALGALLASAALTLAACGDSSTTTVITTGATSTEPTTTTTGSSTTTTGAATTSDLRQAFDNALRTNLVQKQGLSSQQADCVLNELQKTL